MAHPFGGHPTFQEYLTWIRGEGFKYKSGYIALPGESSVTAVLIESPEGNPLLSIPDVDLDERLTPSTIERLDRRLGVKSPFATKPR